MHRILAKGALYWRQGEVRVTGINSGTTPGFSLLEVLVAMFLSTVLTAGIMQLLAGSVSAYRLQLGQSQLEESSRYARDVLVSHISQAGFQPEPWNSAQQLPALTAEAIDAVSPRGDQLGLQRWSRRNCYGNENPVTDSEGKPVFYLLQTRFGVSTANNLALSCRYGPDASQLQTQINNFGLVEDIDSMQVLYAEDRNEDNIADTWVTGQSWQNERDVRAVKVALLLSTRQAFTQKQSRQITLLEKTVTTPGDGHLRKVGSLTAAIQSRLK